MAPGMEILVQVVITVVKGITALVNLFIKLPKPVQVLLLPLWAFCRHWAHVDYGNDGSAKISTVSAGLALVQGNIGKLGGGLSKLSASLCLRVEDH